MFEESEKPSQGKDPIEALSEVLAKHENRPLLKKIEKNTSILPVLLRALTITKGARGAHFYVRDIPKSQKPLQDATPRVSTSSVAKSSVKTAAIRPAAIVPATKSTVAAVVEPQNEPRIERAVLQRTRAIPANTQVAVRTREANGRFTSGEGKSVGQREKERQNEERQAKGLKGWFKAAIASIVGNGKDKGGDVQDAAGKAIGGPIWEAAKEMQGAASELKDKILDDKTLLGKSFRWMSKKNGALKGASAPPTEGAEQRRHRELLEAVRNSGGGAAGGSGGISDVIEGGIGAIVGRKLFSKIPGAGLASKFLAKAAPLVSMLTAGATVVAIGTITAAAAGYAGIMGILNRGKQNGWNGPLDAGQSKAIDPRQTKAPTAAEKAKWQKLAAMAPEGTVLGAAPGVTTTVGAGGSIIRRAGNRNWRNHNPGNLEYGPFARSMGATGSDGRFAVFPNYSTGRKAMGEKLFKSDKYKTTTLSSAIAKWAPPGENNTAAYQKAVLAAVGGKNKKMSEYTRSEQQRIMDAMQKVEGFREGVTEAVATPSSKKTTVRPTSGERRTVPQPVSMRDQAPAAVVAQLAGADRLVAALERQNAPKKETAAATPIKKHFDETILNLYAHDRI